MFSPAEAAYLGHALEPYRLYFYEDPIRPLNPHVAATGARQGEPADRDRRAARAQVGVPAADRERAGRLPAHRHGARGRHHRGEEDPRRRRDARAALRPPPRQLAGQRRGLPARRPGGAELRHPGVDGARAALRALPERASRGGRLRDAAAGPGPRPRARRDGGAQAPLPGRPLPQRYWPDGSVGDY